MCGRCAMFFCLFFFFFFLGGGGGCLFVCFFFFFVFFSLETFILYWVYVIGDTARPYLRVTDGLICSRELI